MAAGNDLDLLAAEYVLGALASDERTAAERRLLDNPDLAARVAAWQMRLAPLAEDLAPVAPRPQVWQQIRRSLTAARREPRVPWWRWLGLWRGWAGISTAAALGLLAMVVTAPSPAPLVAVLTAADGRPVWLVSAAADEEAPPIPRGAAAAGTGTGAGATERSCRAIERRRSTASSE